MDMLSSSIKAIGNSTSKLITSITDKNSYLITFAKISKLKVSLSNGKKEIIDCILIISKSIQLLVYTVSSSTSKSNLIFSSNFSTFINEVHVFDISDKSSLVGLQPLLALHCGQPIVDKQKIIIFSLPLGKIIEEIKLNGEEALPGSIRNSQNFLCYQAVYSNSIVVISKKSFKVVKHISQGRSYDQSAVYHKPMSSARYRRVDQAWTEREAIPYDVSNSMIAFSVSQLERTPRRQRSRSMDKKELICSKEKQIIESMLLIKNEALASIILNKVFSI